MKTLFENKLVVCGAVGATAFAIGAYFASENRDEARVEELKRQLESIKKDICDYNQKKANADYECGMATAKLFDTQDQLKKVKKEYDNFKEKLDPKREEKLLDIIKNLTERLDDFEDTNNKLDNTVEKVEKLFDAFDGADVIKIL